MSATGHERPSRAGSGSGHVRFAPKATVGHGNAIRRYGPQADSCTAANRGRKGLLMLPTVPLLSFHCLLLL
jgi:hypothetical protein